jgi:predicted nucleic acid-binding protein
MIAVDTNVLIYACDNADPRRQQIALDLVTNVEDGVLLWQVACEFISASRKLSKQGFTSTDAWNASPSSATCCLSCCPQRVSSAMPKSFISCAGRRSGMP